METLKINQQKPSDKLWLDEAGQAVPYGYVKGYQRDNEKNLAKLAKGALDLNARLTAFKKSIKQTTEELYCAFLHENNGKKPGKGKGGITLFNFDRSIKIEVDINDNIVLDQSFVNMAKAELDDMLQDGLDGAKDFIKPILMDAFSTTGGTLDYKKVLGLRKYTDEIKDERFAKAMSFIDKSITRPSSTEYFRVSVRNEAGKYVDIQLNFAKI